MSISWRFPIEMKTVALLILLFVGCLITLGAPQDAPSLKESSAANPVAAKDNTASTDNTLEVSIAIPFSSNGERVLYQSHLRFPVVVTNRSDKPQRIFETWNSWGYYSLSFEVTDAEGKTWQIKEGPQVWTVNGPAYWILPPHEHLVLEVNFDDNGWAPLSQPMLRSGVYSIRAVFETSPTEESKKLSVWTGRVVSRTEKYTVYNPR